MPKYYALKEVIDALRAEVERAESQVAYARMRGYTPAYLSDVLHGRRDPGPKVLKSLGFVIHRFPSVYMKMRPTSARTLP